MGSRFGLRDKLSENHWKLCKMENLRVSKPLIICLSGNGTKTEEEANGFCKLAEDFIGDKLIKDVELLGVAYGEQNRRGELSNEDVELIVDNVLIKLCKDEKTEEFLSLEKCCKNLSLVTFFTFCHGSTEVSRILEKFKERLNDKKIPKQDISTLTKALLEVSYAKENNGVPCPQISVASAQDSAGLCFGYWYFGADCEDKLENHYAITCDKPGQYCKKDFPRPEERQYNSITIVADSILKYNNDSVSFSIQSEDHNIGYLKRDKNGMFHPRLNELGKVLICAMSQSLQERVKNSILNQNNENYTRFNLSDLNSYLELNLPQTNRIDNQIEDTMIF